MKKFRRTSVRGPGAAKTGKRKFRGRDMSNSMSQLAKRIKRIDRTIETKSGVQTFTDGIELGHNKIQLYSSTLLATNLGLQDVESIKGNRIGDKITLFSVTITGMIELNERYSDVGVKVMIIKSAKGDIPSNSTIWQGASASKLLDTFNTERFPILKSKFIKLKAPNMSIQASGTQTIGSGFTQGGTEHVQSRASRMFNISIPGALDRLRFFPK